MNTAESLASLESWAVIGLDELNYDLLWDHSATQDMEEEAEEVVAEEKEVVEVTEASTKVSRCLTQNYNQKEGITLCDAWCAISMGATIGRDQTKTMFWERITNHYNNSVDVRSTRTQGSLGHHWAPFITNATDCVDQVNHAPPSGVQVAEYGPYIEELFKHRNTKFGHKPVTLHHCYKELCKNEKWIQIIAEATPKR